MEAQDNSKVHRPQRTEELQHIIDRMPTKFSKWVTLLVVFLLVAIGVFGWVVKYHDVISGTITVSQYNAPVKMVANTHGKLALLIKNGENIKNNQYMAFIQNATSIDDLVKLTTILDVIDLGEEDKLPLIRKQLLNNKFSLGELNYKYYQFLNSLNLFLNYNHDGIYRKQEETLAHLLAEYDKMQQSIKTRSDYNQKNSSIIGKFHQRDSILLSKKVISQAEFERSQLNYIGALSSNENSVYQLSELAQQIKSTKNKLDLLGIEKDEKYIQLKIEVSSAFADLKDNIRIWEEKYVFKAPIDGVVQFLKFWNNNHFVQSGEPVLSIIPADEKLYGQLSLPNLGAGKVKQGQEVIIKLDDFPYMEYGSIKGRVKNISLSTNTQQTQNGVLENYLVNVELPSGLITNYSVKLSGKNEIKGTAEIITSNRRLAQRVFDNLKYLLNNE